ncbi:MAG TPA: AAA domain-containing protein [Flavipsychrobacter sp.]|nr:AAA domain-containing protein [Flavipsychrobacter sp.]
MKLDESALVLLKKKLTIGNSRSVLLKALPGKTRNRLALNDLNLIESSLVKAFLDELTLKPSFSFPFNLSADTVDEELKKKLLVFKKRISSIQYDHQDYLQEFGITTAGFGFPILLKKQSRSSDKFIAAPLFIWKLNIEASHKKINHWTISREREHEIRLNEVLASYLESEESFMLPPLRDELLEDGLLSKEEITGYVELLMKQLGGRVNQFNWENVDKIPDSKEIVFKDIEKGVIIWSGVFSLYKSQKQSIIKDYEHLLKNGEAVLEKEFKPGQWEQNHSPVSTDPSQNLVLRSLSSQGNVVIQGPPGTGKSQTLTAIIASALSNNKKVLVVCEKRTALDVLKNNLEKLLPEFSGCIALIEDPVKSRTEIVNKVRGRMALSLKDEHELKRAVADDILRFESHAAKIEQQYNALKSPVWRNKKWSELVGKYIKINRGKPDLNVLQAVFYEIQKGKFSDEDYFLFTEQLANAAELFLKIATEQHELQELFSGIDTTHQSYSRDLIFTCRQQLQKLEKIALDVNKLTDHYRKSWIIQGNTDGKKLQELISDINDIVNTHQTLADILNPPLGIRIMSIFSQKYRRVLLDKKRVIHLIDAALPLWQMRFSMPLNHLKLGEVLSDFSQMELSYEQKLENEKLNEPVTSVNKTLYEFDADSWKKLISTISEITGELQKWFYLAVDKVENIQVRELADYVETLVKSIKYIISKEIAVDDYCRWQFFRKQLSERNLQLLSNFTSLAPVKWKQTFEAAWLYYKLDNEDAQGKYPTDDATFKILRSLGFEIRDGQISIIKNNIATWFNTGQEKTKKLGIEISQLYNLRGSKGKARNSLRKIIQLNSDAFTDFFPVIMTNPSTCSSLLALDQTRFDLVVFDEASQLRVEDTYPALLRANQVVVSGDSQQMPPSSYFESTMQLIDEDDTEEDEEESDEIEKLTSSKAQQEVLNAASRLLVTNESLLEFALEAGFTETYLNMHYRSRHPDLIQFSNVCFYRSRLVPMPARDELTPIKYVQVNGLYEKSKNDDEAFEIVRILKEEVDTKFSVGIATFNLTQRNNILDLISEERQSDTSFNEKMTAFEENEDTFFVKNLENVQGDERDIIILSTTFGKDKNGRFIKNFGPITNSANGYRLLNVIITRAKYRLFVVTSIPETSIQEYRGRIEANRKVDGRAGLMGYLAYAKAVSESNKVEKENILKFIESKLTLGTTSMSSESLGLTESPFEEEVYSWLSEVVGEERIQLQYPCGGFRIDMVVFSKDKSSSTMLAIECDGAAYHSDELAWHHDMYRQEQLEKCGFTFHRIWSTNWWRNPDMEFEKLLQVINTLN